MACVRQKIINKNVAQQSISEVAWLVDYESLYYNAHWKSAPAFKNWQHSIFDWWFWIIQQGALYRLSAPFDTFIWKDIIGNRKYKLYLVSNVFLLTDEQLKRLKAAICRDNSVVVWVYAPGFVSPEGLSVEHVSKLTGIELKMTTAPAPMLIDVIDSSAPITRSAESSFGVNQELYPRFIIDDPAAKVLGIWRRTKEPAFATKNFKDWTSIYIGFAPVPPKILRNIAKFAGIHIYSNRMDIVYANATYTAVVANGSGKRTITLPYKMRDALTGKSAPTKFTLQLSTGEVKLFEKVAGRTQISRTTKYKRG